jgi:cystathionine beta-lyase
MGLTTKILNSLPIDPLTGAVSVPIYQTATFVQEEPGVHKGFDYARTNNPTRKILEDSIAELENGAVGVAFASGLAAIDAVAKLLRSGDEVIAVDDIYGGAYRLFTMVFSNFDIRIKFVNTADVEEVRRNIGPDTKLIWLESPTNPTLKISDISAISALAREHGILTCVDNTFATPALQNPLDLGADIVVHSATKYLGGHSDLIAGLVVTKSQELGERIKFIQNATGAILSPMDSWLVIRGLTTLELRVGRQSETALDIANFLKGIEAVDSVYYPGLPGHLNYDIACRQQSAFGGMLSFTLKNDSIDDAVKFVSSTKLFKLAESLGGVRSLICHPAKMTHKSIPREQRYSSGVKDSLIRLSVGIENSQDLIEDIDNTFKKI